MDNPFQILDLAMGCFREEIQQTIGDEEEEEELFSQK